MIGWKYPIKRELIKTFKNFLKMSFYPNVIVYRDRLHAGTELAKLLVDKYKNSPSNPVVVIALPRGLFF